MLNKLFRLEELGTTVRTEIAAGFTTFLTAAYIIFVNPSILGTTGMDRAALVTVTCLATGGATLLMGLWGRAPLMLAPGMGLNSFFAFGLCQAAGVPWQTALGVVFLSGLVFLGLALLGLREKILNAIPKSLRLSTSVGIGLFIAFIGLQQLGLIGKSEATIVKLGALTTEGLLGLIGFLVIASLLSRKFSGSLLLGILLVTILGVLTGKVAPPQSIVSLPQSITPVFLKLDIKGALTLAFLPAIFSFMYVDLFDSLGTFFAVSKRAGMVREDGTIRNLGKLLRIDCLSTIFGSLLGTSTVTTYVESATGISQGGRSGLTAVSAAFFFFLAIFFSPIILTVPAFATAPALLIVGIYMVRDIQDFDFSNWEELVPAFMTMLLMPLTFSISTGIMFGFLTYAAMKLLAGKVRELSLPVAIIAILSALNLVINAG